MMAKEEEKKVREIEDQNDVVAENEETEAIEFVLFQVSECYVYLVSLLFNYSCPCIKFCWRFWF